MPSSIAQLHREMKDRGLVVLAISLQESPAKVQSWARSVGLPFPPVLDEDGRTGRAWRVRSTPTVFLLDREGRVVGSAVGMKAWASPTGRALLTALLAS